MPMKKTTTTKKYTKRYGKRIPRAIPTKRYHGVKYFTETIQDFRTIVSPLISGGTTENDYNLAFSVSQMNNINNYQNLFKQYAILGVKIIYRPNYNVQVSGATTIGIPRMFFAVDKATASGSTLPIPTLQQQDNCKVLMSNKSFTHYIRRPQPELYQFDNGGTDIQAQQRSKELYWITFGEVSNQLDYLNSLIDVAGNNNADFAVGTISLRVYMAVKEQF